MLNVDRYSASDSEPSILEACEAYSTTRWIGGTCIACMKCAICLGKTNGALHASSSNGQVSYVLRTLSLHAMFIFKTKSSTGDSKI